METQMSRRKGFIVRAARDLEPQPSPNQQIPSVTCEMRVSWPNNATQEDVERTIVLATAEAFKQYAEKVKDGA